MSDTLRVDDVRVCIDANDVELLSDFWVSFLGYERRASEVPDDDWRHLEPTMPNLPKLTIQPVPEGKTVKNRLHLDVLVTGPEPWIDRAVEVGGITCWRSEEPDDWSRSLLIPKATSSAFVVDVWCTAVLRKSQTRLEPALTPPSRFLRTTTNVGTATGATLVRLRPLLDPRRTHHSLRTASAPLRERCCDESLGRTERCWSPGAFLGHRIDRWC